MQNAPEVHEGDRVRVVLEGEVNSGGVRNFSLGASRDENWIAPSAEHVVSVEVLAKPLKVGDKASGGDYAKLPIGTIVSYGDTLRRVKVGDDTWVRLGFPDETTRNDDLRMARKIEYLP